MNVLEVLAKISLDTTEYDRGLEESKKKTETFGSKVKKGFSTVAGFATKAVVGAAGAVTAFGVASVKTGMKFDTAMSQVGATMGENAQKMVEYNGQSMKSIDALREFAQEMGATTAFSASEAAEALNYMALAGYDAEKSMNMLPNVLNLAAAGAMSLGSASDMVTDAQTALGLSTEQTTTMVDQMAKTSSKTNTSVSQLGEAILTIGATARNVKGGTTELNQVLGVLADNGIKGSEGGTHLRNMLLSLQNPTTEGTKALKELGVEIYNTDGTMRALPDIFNDISKGMEGMDQASKDAMTSGIFNKTDLAAANALIGTNKERWDELAVAITDCNGAAEEMAATQLDNLGGDITLFKSALEGAQIAISDKLTPSLRDFVKSGSEGLSEFTEKLRGGDISGAIESLGAAIGNIAVSAAENVPAMIKAGGQLLIGIGKGIVGNAPRLVKVASDLVMGLYNGLMANAPGLINAGIAMVTKVGLGLVTGIPEFLSNALPMIEQLSGMIRENAGKLIECGLDLIKGIAQGIANSIPVLVQYVPTIITNIAGIINDNVPKLLATGVSIIVTIGKGIIDAIPTIVANIPKIIQAIFSVWSAFNWINLGKTAVVAIENGISQLPTALKGIFGKVGETIKSINWADIGSKIMEMLLNGLTMAIKGIIAFAGVLVSSIWDFITGTDWLSLGVSVVTFIGNGISGAIDILLSVLGGLLEPIISLVSDTFGGAWETVTSVVSSAWETITNVVSVGIGFLGELLNFGIELLMLPWTFLWENFGTIITEKWNQFTSIISGALSAISGVISAVWNAIVSTISAILTAIANKVSAIWNFIKNTISSLVNGAKNIISSAFNFMRSTVANVMDTIGSKISSVWNSAKETVSGAIENVKSTISGGLETAKETVTDIFDSIKESISDKINGAKQAVDDAIEKIKSKFKFSWSLPKLKLPHISISGKWGFNPPSFPSFSIKWYKKAMDDAFLLDGASIFGAANGRLLGGGEAGREIVVGESKALEMISKAAGSEQLLTRVNYLISLLEYYLPKRSIPNNSEIDRMLGTLL